MKKNSVNLSSNYIVFSTKNETMRFLVTNLYRETIKLENYVDNDCPIKISYRIMIIFVCDIKAIST